MILEGYYFVILFCAVGSLVVENHRMVLTHSLHGGMRHIKLQYRSKNIYMDYLLREKSDQEK